MNIRNFKPVILKNLWTKKTLGFCSNKVFNSLKLTETDIKEVRSRYNIHGISTPCRAQLVAGNGVLSLVMLGDYYQIRSYLIVGNRSIMTPHNTEKMPSQKTSHSKKEAIPGPNGFFI
jgi:hypothetical protein